MHKAGREQLLRRVTQDLFGEPPQQGELHDFLIDNSPDVLARLIQRLQNKARIEPFVGKLSTGEIKFRVIAADPNAAKAPHCEQPRTVLMNGVKIRFLFCA